MMKDKIHWTWKKIVGTVLGILGIGTLTSCYGVYEDETGFDVYGNVFGNVNGTQVVIPDIVVQISNNSSDFKDIITTDSAGFYAFRELEEGDYTLRFSDTDGAKNHGKFAQKEFGAGLTKDYHYSPTLELEKTE